MVVRATPIKLLMFQGNTQVITILGLQDSISGSFLNSASLSGTLYDQNNTQVPGCVNIALAYVTGSSGNYQGVFGDNTFLPAPGTGYTLVIAGSQASPSVFIRLEIIVEVQPRNS